MAELQELPMWVPASNPQPSGAPPPEDADLVGWWWSGHLGRGCRGRGGPSHLQWVQLDLQLLCGPFSSPWGTWDLGLLGCCCQWPSRKGPRAPGARMRQRQTSGPAWPTLGLSHPTRLTQLMLCAAFTLESHPCAMPRMHTQLNTCSTPA